ncbi:MAG: MFS transporter [Lautropia sp.]|nr:MFS transporter [Lautropia sp.]
MSEASTPNPSTGVSPLTQPLLRPYEWALLCSAYLSQTVAFSFFFVSLSAILRSRGASLDDLGWLYLLGLIPALKFLWAPLMDRYGFGRRGHYGVWLSIMQLCLIITLLLMSRIPVQSGTTLPFSQLIIGCLFMSFFTACQDMAADGLSVQLLSPRQRGLGNALQMACGTLGFVAGGGGVLMIYNHLGWQPAILSLTALNTLTLLLAVFYREPPHARPAPRRLGGRFAARDFPAAQAPGIQPLTAYWRTLWHFWQKPDTGWRWLLLLLLIQAGVYLSYGVLTPMLVDAGWSLDRIGQVVNVLGTLSGTATMLLLGVAMRRWTNTTTLRVMVPAQLLAVLALATALLSGAGQGWVFLGVALFMGLYMPMGVLMGTLMMGRSSPHTPATDFSMQYGIYLAGGYAAGALSLPLAQRLGYPGLLALGTALCALMIVIVPWLWRRQATVPSSAHPSSGARAGQDGHERD